MSKDGNSEFAESPDTATRLQAITERGYIVVVTRAYGPNGEDLMNHDGPKFEGEPGVMVNVKQGDKEDIVTLSPFFGDPSKISAANFESGTRCELTCPESGVPLDPIPGMQTEDGGNYYAIYLTPKLKNGELVAISDVWGETNSRILSEGELLKLYAESEPIEE